VTVLHAFVDESGRGSRYYVCVAIVAVGDVGGVRQLAQGLRLKGQTRWHFTKEHPSRQKEILSAILRSGIVRVRVYCGKGAEVPLRDAIFRRMGADLAKAGIERLVIESRAQRDVHDRRALYEVLQNSRLAFQHLRPNEDPALWIADAVASTYSAGGRWRELLKPIVDSTTDLGGF
jgi:hypothetical protein